MRLIGALLAVEVALGIAARADCFARAREFAAEAKGRAPTDSEIAYALACMLALILRSAGYQGCA